MDWNRNWNLVYSNFDDCNWLFVPDYLNKDILIGLAIVNPVYFFCMMIGAMKNLSISIAVIGGTILGPFIYLISTEWALLFAGLIAGTIAFLFGGKNGE